jgi:hypothetical protein
MNEPVSTPASAHATHDPALVAALAARPADLTDAQRATARDLVAACGDCSDLLADLVALQVSLPTTATPTRPRDFRLTQVDAERLRAGGWRRVLGFFGSARDSVTRPLAIGLTTLGLVGLMVAMLPSVMIGGGTAAAPTSMEAAAPERAGGAAQAASAAPAASSDAAAAPPSASGAEGFATDRVTVQGAPEASTLGQEGTFSGAEDADAEGQRDVAAEAMAAIRDDTSGLSVLFVVAGVMLIAGLGLFLLRWSAHRLT